MRIIEAGALLDEPIPQMPFLECPRQDGRKMLEKYIHLIAQREPGWTAFQNLIEWLAWGWRLRVILDNYRSLMKHELHGIKVNLDTTCLIQ
jgi:hypothetical protein